MPTSKTVSSFVINKLESQDIYDYLVSNSLINEDELYLVQDTDRYLTEVPITNYSLTLPATGWVSKMQTLTVTGLTATGNGIVGIAQSATTAQYEAAYMARMRVISQSADSLSISCLGTTPEVDIPIIVSVIG